MNKIVVFDSGWGGELFAEHLEREIATIEVCRKIEWRQGPFINYSDQEIIKMTEESLSPVIGRADLIVLASHVISVTALGYLKKKYPMQEFIGFDVELVPLVHKVIDHSKVMMMAPTAVKKSRAYQCDLARLKAHCKIYEPEIADKMVGKIDVGDVSFPEFFKMFGEQEAPDYVFLYETQYRDIRKFFEHLFGWRTCVVDGFDLMTKEVSKKLK